MADESGADDGALHNLYAVTPIERIVSTFVVLQYLSHVRGRPSDEQRELALALANDQAFSQREHPIVRRILGV